ncbi:MAG: glycosyltransferase family 4 protein, partial [bacterium]|nr:glycosyltransferase family 4 protein [bacterium]
HVGHISGAERVLLNLLSQLDRIEYEPIVVAPADGTFLTELTRRGIKTYPIETPLLIRSMNPIQLMKYISKFWKITKYLKTIIINEKIELLHANSFTAMLYSSRAAKQTKCPIIWHMHDIVSPRWFNRLFIRFAGRRAAKVIAVSNAVKVRLLDLGVQSEKCLVIYNGMDCLQPGFAKSAESIKKTKSELKIPTDAIVIGIFGQIAQWKGHHILIQAAPAIIQHYNKVYFIIVGDIINKLAGEYKQRIIDLINDLKLSNRIILTGFRTDIPELMQMVDIVVHSSIMPDPLPTVLLEAMLYRKPVVATKLGGVPEIVEDRHTGILVTPNNIDEMSNAIRTLLDTPELRISYGENGRNRVELHFNITQNISAVESVYKELFSNSIP